MQAKSRIAFLAASLCWIVAGYANATDLDQAAVGEPPKINQSLSYQVSGMAGGSFSSSSLTLNDIAVSATGARGNLAIFRGPQLGLNIGYLTLFNESGGTLLSGIDAGLQWFVLSPGMTSRYSSPREKIQMFSVWRHCLLLGYAQRTANFGVLEVGFSGLRLGYGLNFLAGRWLDISFLSDLVVTADATIENLSATSDNRLSIFALNFGAALEI